jgi:hypothetical protein
VVGIAERSAENDDALFDERVDEGGMLISTGLFATSREQSPAGPGISVTRKCCNPALPSTLGFGVVAMASAEARMGRVDVGMVERAQCLARVDGERE